MSDHLCVRDVDFTFASRDEGDEERGQGEGQDGRTLSGYAAVFGVPTEINSWEGRFNETISRGAFARSLTERAPIMQWDHGRDARVGSTPIGVYTNIAEDDHGLRVEGRLFDNNVVEPVRQAIEAQAVRGMSFKFKVTRDSWSDAEGKALEGRELYELLYDAGERGPLNREIQEVRLYEAGPVSHPAYDETSVGVRSLSEDERKAFIEECVRTATEQKLPDSVVPEAETESRDASPEAEPEGHPEKQATPSTRKASVPMETMTIDERIARQGDIKARLSEIDNEYSGATLPEETQREWNSLQGEYREHDAAIRAQQERAEQLRELAGDEETHDRPTSTRRFTSTVTPGGRRSENIYDMSALRQRAYSLDDLDNLCRDNAMRAVEQHRFPGVDNREAAQERVAWLVENITEKDEHGKTIARKILETGSPVYERAFGKVASSLNANGLTSEERAALAVGASATGGYAIPFQLDPSVILTNDGRIDPLRSVARVATINGKEWQGITSAGVSVSRSAEATQVAATDPALAQPTVKAERVTGFVSFSMEVDQDWAQMRSEVTSILADAKAEEEATAFALGDGIAPNANGIIATLNSSSHVATTTASTFAVGDLYKLEEALPPRFRAAGRFLASKTIYNKVRQFGTSDGHALWERVGNGMPPELLGYPALEASKMATATTTNSLIMLMGDFKHFLIVDRLGMTVELVPHLLGANQRPTGQRGLLAVWRNNSKILVDNAFRLLKVA